ncbi:MAG: hypothetical protein AMS18_05765 [Gemmatimonas sp. SG8_17]|nr:MAG: hypothetical protein AMS18_05765 [Gemmatimonas sp. SG8_17]
MNGRYAVVGGAVGFVIIMLLGMPAAIRHVSFFRVRQVELVGVRYHVPREIIAELGLLPEQSLFAPAGEIEQRAMQIPGIIGARVERRIPGTLRVVLQEQMPIAFAPGATGLVVLDADASPLAYDPAATGLDLPLVEQVDSLLVRTLAALRSTDSAFYWDVDVARRGGGGNSVVLELGQELVILKDIPTAREIAAIGAVRQHLSLQERAFEQLDARFDHKVFVRLSGA